MSERFNTNDKSGELPLYKLVNELTQVFLGYAKDIPKLYRYALVERACDQLVEVLSYIYLAGLTSDKIEKRQYLLLSKQLMAKVIIEVRLLHDVGALGNKPFVLLAQKSDEINKQLYRWSAKLSQ
ncbi:MAG: hypothetical protein LBK47_10495 [Prevotellaceae bacterium]|jgi:hypothetical protein|nr:hypothetical protein [Prevotellaceae bacterium]